MAAERDRLDPLSFDAPVVTQVSRFDPWNDQFSTLEAYRRARESVDSLQLALVGSIAGDDPEGIEVYERVAREAADDPHVADHIVTLLEDEHRQTRFGANGREHVRERFLLPRQLTDLFEVLVEVSNHDRDR